MKIVKVGSTKITGHSVKNPILLDGESKVKLAEKYRNNPTQSEQRLCDMLDEAGYKYKFQALMFGYIADFYFPLRSWIVELDGKRWHNEQKDAERDAAFAKKGIKTLRIPSSAMFSEPKMVLKEIETTLHLKAKSKKKKHRKR